MVHTPARITASRGMSSTQGPSRALGGPLRRAGVRASRRPLTDLRPIVLPVPNSEPPERDGAAHVESRDGDTTTESRNRPCPSVEYFVASFPSLRNTFVVREMDGLVRSGLDIRVVGLLRPEEGVGHARVKRWAADVGLRPSRRRCARDMCWWLARRPGRSLATAASILRFNALRLHRPRAGFAALVLGAYHARRLRERRATHLHAHFEIPTDTVWVIHRLAGLDYSFTVHTDETIAVPSLGRNARSARFVATVSHYTEGHLRERVGRDVRIAVVRAAIPADSYAFRPRSIPESGPVRAVCVAGLEPCKGHGILLEALAGDDDLQRITVDVVGDGPIRQDLESLAARLGLADRVDFVGARTEDEVRTILGDSDMFILPCTVDERGYHDNLPVALMEAMACGLPVVSTRLGGIPELVVDGVTGFLARPGDADDLAGVLRRLLACGSDELGHICERARATVEEEFDLRANTRRLAALLCRDPVARGREGDARDARARTSDGL